MTRFLNHFYNKGNIPTFIQVCQEGGGKINKSKAM
jgi:hypothetical protein